MEAKSEARQRIASSIAGQMALCALGREEPLLLDEIDDDLRANADMLFDLVPNRYIGPDAHERSYVTANSVWQKWSEWFTDWLKLVAANGTPRDFIKLFELGIHPDDPRFGEHGFDKQFDAYNSPELVRSALKHGASHREEGSFRQTLLGNALNSIRTGLNSFGRDPRGQHAIDVSKRVVSNCESLCAILDSGSAKLGPTAADIEAHPGDIHPVAFLLSWADLQAAGPHANAAVEEACQAVLGVIQRLALAGANVNAKGMTSEHSVIEALRFKNLRVAVALVEAGASLDDDEIRGARSGAAINAQMAMEAFDAGFPGQTALHQAQKMGGEGWVVQLRAAQMSRQIRDSLPAEPAEVMTGNQSPRRPRL